METVFFQGAIINDAASTAGKPSAPAAPSTTLPTNQQQQAATTTTTDGDGDVLIDYDEEEGVSRWTKLYYCI
jgi:hypothetical protein